MSREPVKQMTLEEYKTRLVAHDWEYEMSDDHSVYKRGLKDREELFKIAMTDVKYYELFNKIKKEMKL
jgi:hypothetical protein